MGCHVSPKLLPATLVVSVTRGILYFQGICIIVLAMDFSAKENYVSFSFPVLNFVLFFPQATSPILKDHFEL